MHCTFAINAEKHHNILNGPRHFLQIWYYVQIQKLRCSVVLQILLCSNCRAIYLSVLKQMLGTKHIMTNTTWFFLPGLPIPNSMLLWQDQNANFFDVITLGSWAPKECSSEITWNYKRDKAICLNTPTHPTKRNEPSKTVESMDKSKRSKHKQIREAPISGGVIAQKRRLQICHLPTILHIPASPAAEKLLSGLWQMHVIFGGSGVVETGKARPVLQGSTTRTSLMAPAELRAVETKAPATGSNYHCWILRNKNI